MSNRFENAGKKAQQDTNQELAAKMAEVTGLSSEELARLFPTQADMQSLEQLMGIVKSATSHNEQVAAFKGKLDTCAASALTLAKAFLKIV